MIRKVIPSLLFTTFVLVVLYGCNGSGEGSYAGILMIDGIDYTWQGDIENKEFTIANKIGEVEKTVDKEIIPKTNFSSNMLEVGAEIFTSNEDAGVIIVKREHDGEYDKFIEKGYYKDIREIAWNFLVDKGWSDSASEEWESATVTKITVNEAYHLLDNSYEGEEVFSVSFADRENVVTTTPIILVDAYRNKEYISS
ncbi:hypothetical protein [Aquibacillus salsiterrae]|uniref:Uncharacterized protein n=1 Tax=Aquibacillus salsiterrae TaxID=2950439 RepID=A0A9X3WEP1_9BACI|nr:hypothetical protein [Aquibacillus salsiterrae]MDC3418392.1 hypothetical protein [Aquibacillus salsiterrae]